MDLKLLNKKEVGEILRLSPSGVDSLRKSGGLPFVKIGSKVYVKEQDLETFVNENTTTNARS